MRKPLLVAVSLCVTATIALGGVALADAASSTPTPSTSAQAHTGKGYGVRVGGNLGIAATLLGKTEDALRQELQSGANLHTMLQAAGKLDAYRTQVLEAIQTKLTEAVAAGKIDQAKADEALINAKKALEAWDGTRNPALGNGGHDRGIGHGSTLTIASGVLGITQDALRAQIRSGSTLGSLLTSAGKLDAFKAAYLQNGKARLDEAVTAGKLTQAQADERYAALQANIQAWDGTGSLGKGFGLGGRDGDGGHGGRTERIGL